MSVNQTKETTNNIKEGIDMKQYVLKEFKDKFSVIGGHIEYGECSGLDKVIEQWIQLGLIMIELSERDNQKCVNFDGVVRLPYINAEDIQKTIEDSFVNELDEYIDGKTLCVQGIKGKMDLEGVSTEELINELGKREMTDEEFIKRLAKPLSDLLIKSYTPYTQIVISTEGTRVTQDIKGITYNSVG